MTLFGDDGSVVVTWDQANEYGDRVELCRSPDGAVALVVVDEAITSVRLADGHIAATGGHGRGIEASFPLDGRWTLEIAGELNVDGGHTGFQGGSVGFYWDRPEPLPDRATIEAESAGLRAGRAAVASAPLRRRVTLRDDAQAILVHEAVVAPVAGGEVLLWPPITGSTGVLLRHAVVTDDGSSFDEAPQPPWLVRTDGTVTLLPFELGVSPLLALPGDRWLLPGLDTVWRDDYDEPLSILDAGGETEPLLVGGKPVPVSRVLREAAPQLLATLEPPDLHQDVPWHTVAGRLDAGSDELFLAVSVGPERETLLVVSIPLSGANPAREIARFESTPSRQVAVAP